MTVLATTNQRKLFTVYVILAAVFGGLFSVLMLYTDSYLDVWNIPIWGTYIVLNLVLSMGGAVAAIPSIAKTSMGRLVLFGLAGILIFLDIRRISLDIGITSPEISNLTLATPVFLVHAYLLFLLIKSKSSVR